MTDATPSASPPARADTDRICSKRTSGCAGAGRFVFGAVRQDLVFKGGTSLSKAYQAIRRFSEDIDITYDIRALAPDFSGDGEDPLPATRSQERRWTRAIRARLAAWTREHALTAIEAGLTRTRFDAEVRAEDDRVYIAYAPVLKTTVSSDRK